METQHPLLSNYSFTKWGKGMGRLLEGGGGEAALILNFDWYQERLYEGALIRELGANS